MNECKNVIYQGIPCILYYEYLKPGDGPLVKVKNSADLEKAYELGFECVGHPTEVVKYISKEEWEAI